MRWFVACLLLAGAMAGCTGGDAAEETLDSCGLTEPGPPQLEPVPAFQAGDDPDAAAERLAELFASAMGLDLEAYGHNEWGHDDGAGGIRITLSDDETGLVLDYAADLPADRAEHPASAARMLAYLEPFLRAVGAEDAQFDVDGDADESYASWAGVHADVPWDLEAFSWYSEDVETESPLPIGLAPTNVSIQLNVQPLYARAAKLPDEWVDKEDAAVTAATYVACAAPASGLGLSPPKLGLHSGRVAFLFTVGGDVECGGGMAMWVSRGEVAVDGSAASVIAATIDPRPLDCTLTARVVG